MKPYDHKKIEKKWQNIWEEKGIYNAEDASGKPKFYALIEFPYPSGDGLHVGHVRSNTAMDIIARKRRMEGYNVLYPIGWDAFGLPTENYAIKTGIQPSVVTKQNTDTFRRQLKAIGFSFDWTREINTTDPAYYKWTQWLFLQFHKHGLAYKKKMAINWCPKDKIGLANEEVIDGCCERCGTPVEKREKEQWMLAITKYADALAKDLDETDFQEKIKLQQRNWIGKSEGAEIDFEIIAGQETGGAEGSDISETATVFTTRPDTLFGVTYIVLAPEHQLVQNLRRDISNWKEVEAYIASVRAKNDLDRTAEGKEKTGVQLKGIAAIHPATRKRIPVWIADYVLASYGTGAVMAVPAHDERDFEFAQKYHLPMQQVVAGEIGKMINSADFDGQDSEIAKKNITEQYGRAVATFKLRDWVFSRQRYWGEPIPMVYCEACAEKGEGWVPVPETELPVTLPNVEKYEPTDTGESPLAAIDSWVRTTCPKCGGEARRETDTMPNWAGSSWYFLRYIDPHNEHTFADAKKMKHWMPVDWYNGGMEHTTLHLLYSRFWNKFLYDIGLVPTSEPYKKRTSHGLILAEGGVKMSKSKGNVINPDDVVGPYGADTLRLYEMFMGPFDQAIAWSTDSIIGSRRFVERVWKLQEQVNQKSADPTTDKKIKVLLNQTIKKVSDDIEHMQFNTAISSMMIFANALEARASGTIPKDIYETFLKILSPFAPHITEELWETLGHTTSIHTELWPQADSAFLENDTVTMVVQINGKMRASIEMKKDTSEQEIESNALSLPDVEKWISGKEIKKIIHVKGKLVNIVL